MRYQWFKDGVQQTPKQLAEWVARHAHELYTAGECFLVREADGYEGRLGQESVYREDAFWTAAEHYKCSYEVFYDAWLEQKPVNQALLTPG